jgi:hypothetical protein
VSWNRRGAKLTLIYEQREQLRLDDEDGTVELMLDLLRVCSMPSHRTSLFAILVGRWALTHWLTRLA